ncbi:acetyltransferase [Sanguibacter sp. HDW7]|uniref:acetyltransferase n=1 Tax=Sanguibacter sp. HDW7 TaxID=2714931 RepID=UPI001408E81B|nr:acetyltransferase [Sanguibacter sp. HDW7]QIK84266.1 acetyltransferase [Sanguibacter sp. HDW7]
MSRPLVIVGAGGFGRELADVVDDLNAETSTFELLGYLDDGPAEADLARLASSGLDYLGTVESFLAEGTAEFVIGIASPRARRAVDTRLTSAGHEAATLVHPSVTTGRHVEMGSGTILCAGARLTTNISLGRHVHVNLNATVGHDSVLEDYVTIYPGAAVSGNVVLEESVSMGVGSAVLQGLRIGARTFVGGAALVTKDAGPDLVLKGVPAR